MGTIFPGSIEPGMDENRAPDRLMTGGGVKREKMADIGRYMMVSGDREIIQIRKGV